MERKTVGRMYIDFDVNQNGDSSHPRERGALDPHFQYIYAGGVGGARSHGAV